MFGAIAGGIASALAGGAMSKLFGGGQKAASGGIQGDVLATDNNTVGIDRKSGSAGMPRPISYAVFCLKKKKNIAIESSIEVVIDHRLSELVESDNISTSMEGKVQHTA